MHNIPFEHAHVLSEKEFKGCCRNCEHSEEIIKQHIINFYNKIISYTPNLLKKLPPTKLYELYQVLDDIAQLKAGDRLASLVLSDPDIKPILPTIRAYYSMFFDIHEKFFAEFLISSKRPWKFLDSFPLLPKYEELTYNFGKGLNIKDNFTVAFLGCGALPISCILASKIFNLKNILAIDRDIEKVGLARKCINSLDIKNIEVVVGDETYLSNVDVDLVLIAALAEPKKRIFAYIKKLLQNGKKFLVACRTYTGLKAVLYRPILEDDIKGFVVLKEIRPQKYANNTLLFLKYEPS